MKIPEKVTTYGGPKDPFVKVVETFKRVGATVVVNRTVTTKAACERIVIDLTIPRGIF